jgi:hypothetical protein
MHIHKCLHKYDTYNIMIASIDRKTPNDGDESGDW